MASITFGLFKLLGFVKGERVERCLKALFKTIKQAFVAGEITCFYQCGLHRNVISGFGKAFV